MGGFLKIYEEILMMNHIKRLWKNNYDDDFMPSSWHYWRKPESGGTPSFQMLMKSRPNSRFLSSEYKMLPGSPEACQGHARSSRGSVGTVPECTHKKLGMSDLRTTFQNAP